MHAALATSSGNVAEPPGSPQTSETRPRGLLGQAASMVERIVTIPEPLVATRKAGSPPHRHSQAELQRDCNLKPDLA